MLNLISKSVFLSLQTLVLFTLSKIYLWLILYRNYKQNNGGRAGRNLKANKTEDNDNDYMSVTSCNTQFKLAKRHFIKGGSTNRAGLESGGSYSIRSKFNMSLITPNTYSQRQSQNVSTANSVERPKFMNMSNPNP